MAFSSKKFYHQPDFDSRGLIDTYYSKKSDMGFQDETIKIPMQKLHDALSAGRVKGNILTDISIGSFPHHLYSACDFFKEIIVLKFNERCIMELNKWRHDRTGAYDWSHARDVIKQLQTESDREEEKDLKLKAAITHVVKCDINKKNLIDPLVVPSADCLISVWLLECISKDKEEYIQNLKKFTTFVKCGGQLILFGTLNATYFMIGTEKFHVLTHDEKFLKEALIGVGFRIDHIEVCMAKVKSDKADYKGIIFVMAHKEEQI